MDGRNRGGESAERKVATTEVHAAWTVLRSRLTDHLMRMSDDGDHLLVELPDGHGPGCTPYAQFAGFGGGSMIRAELSSNVYLAPAHQLDAESCGSLQLMGWLGGDEPASNWYLERPRGDAALVATMVVGALQAIFGVEHPQLLTYDAFGPNAGSAEELGLTATEDVPIESAPQPMALAPNSRHELIEMVGATLSAHLGERPPFLPEGSFVLTHLGQTVRVLVRDDQPAVEILARVTHGVHSRRATAAEIAVLNRRHMWTQWVLRDREVWMRLPMPALPFVPQHLVSMLDIYLEAMAQTRNDLAFRTGGRVA